jgi:hypothetical protein
VRRKPTELDKSRAWPVCDLCKEATPFLFRWLGKNSCIPCYDKGKVA